MKSIILIPVLFIILMSTSHAQMKLGLRASSHLIYNRMEGGADALMLSNDGVSLRPSFGIIADMPFSQNYYLSTGLGYIPKRMKFVSSTQDGIASSEYIAQYIELPVSLKLYTNEIDLDKRVYFQLGSNIDIKVYDENKKGPDLIKKIRPYDITLLLASGVEIYLGTNTSILMGLSYQRGLINIISDTNTEDDFSLKNDLFGLDIAIKL